MSNIKATRKRQTRNLVPIGTHVPMNIKLTIEALAQSQNKSVYELLQETVTDMANDYDKELEELQKKNPPVPSKSDDEELLG